MLLRLRWDDRDEVACKKLKSIVARIWDALEGIDLTGKAPLSSALWLDDDDKASSSYGGTMPHPANCAERAKAGTSKETVAPEEKVAVSEHIGATPGKGFIVHSDAQNAENVGEISAPPGLDRFKVFKPFCIRLNI